MVFRTSATQRVFVIAFALLVIVGALAQLPRWRGRTGDRPPPATQPWPSGAHSKANYLAGVTPVDPQASGVDFFKAVLSDQLSRPFTLELRSSVEQILSDSTVHHYAFSLQSQMDGARGRIDVEFYRERGDTMWFSADVAGPFLSALRWLGDGGAEDGSAQVDPSLPLMLGDILVTDPVAMFDALRNGRLDAAGVDGGELVLDVALVPDDTLIAWRRLGRPDPRGASALVRVGATDRRLRTVRVFNAHGREVRVYDSFDASPDGRIRAFRAESIAGGSQAYYLIENTSVTNR